MARAIASRTIAAGVLLALMSLARPGVIAAPPAPPPAPATAGDVATLRQVPEQLRVQLAALQRRLDSIEEQINSIQK
ncbi:MAG TPA: hypothetical protein VJT33_09425 [bacterium]|nr:hypothetical protein [bacterium]